jgi:hypothetical protein
VKEVVHPPEPMLAEVASLFHLLGGMAPKHFVVVGGLVPPLLAPASAASHVGSADIDLSLSVAITKGETSEYYRSLEATIEPYFELVEGGFRWRKKAGIAGLPLLVDFMGPEDGAVQVEDGSLLMDDAVARGNTGARLRPFPLEAAALVEKDAQSRRIAGVELVYKPGVRADVDVRHAGPVGFLASKADALATRDDPKDGYDVAWLCVNAPGESADVARLVIERPCFKDPYFPDSVAKLKQAFRERDYPGPSGYAQECNPEAGPGDEAYELDRNRAFAAVTEVLVEIEQRLWD